MFCGVKYSLRLPVQKLVSVAAVCGWVFKDGNSLACSEHAVVAHLHGRKITVAAQTFN